jgi:hypothetical protein
MSIALFKAWVYGQKDYIARLVEVCTDVETYLNQIFAQLTGQSGALAVPLGLQEIFDRRGLIGIGSYDFTEATLSGPAYNFSVAAGAYYNAGIFYHKAGASTLSMAGRDTGAYYLGLDGTGNPLIQASPDATTTRQFSWSSSTHAISAKALYAGVAVLLDGDEYADMLTSAARAKTFTKVADRLEEIEVLLGKNVQTPASADNITINWDLGGTARVTLNRPLTTFHFTGGYDAQRLVLDLLQDGVGGREIAFGAEVDPGIDFTFPVPLSVDGDKLDKLGFMVHIGRGVYDYSSLARGYGS